MEHLQESRFNERENPVISILGEKVALGPIRRDLVPLYHRWINDFAVLRTLHIPRSSTLEEVQAEVEKIKKRVENFGEINPMALEAFEEMKKRYDFIIVQKRSCKLISMKRTRQKISMSFEQNLLD